MRFEHDLVKVSQSDSGVQGNANSGSLRAVHVSEGEHVTAGQLLAGSLRPGMSVEPKVRVR